MLRLEDIWRQANSRQEALSVFDRPAEIAR